MISMCYKRDRISLSTDFQYPKNGQKILGSCLVPNQQIRYTALPKSRVLSQFGSLTLLQSIYHPSVPRRFFGRSPLIAAVRDIYSFQPSIEWEQCSPPTCPTSGKVVQARDGPVTC
jgi:hypothetical protein